MVSKLLPKCLYPSVVLIVFLLLGSCTSRYFRHARQEPPLSLPTLLTAQPASEYWTGIVFNGSKIGFSHFMLSPSPTHQDRFDIHSEAYFRFRFLLVDKKVNLKSHDVVASDLSLIRFEYTISLDDSQMAISGQQNASQLTMTIRSSGEANRRSIEPASKVYPSSAILLYPLIHGIEVGRQYIYDVFDGQTQKVERVEQEITAYEESELFTGPAFKIRTRFRGQTMTTWMNARGQPLLEMSLGNTVISIRESKTTARNYLSQAAFNKDETLLDFSLIKIDAFGYAPKKLHSLTVEITGMPDTVDLPDDERQACNRDGGIVRCQTSTLSALSTAGRIETASGKKGANHRYLVPSIAVSSGHPQILQMARQIAGDILDSRQRVQALLDWMQVHIEREATDVFTALDVLKTRRAECQGHAMLFAAFARSLAMPTRIVNGIVYVPRFSGFLYHSWNETLIDGRWMAVDPTFSQFPADASHIKFVEGDGFSDVLPLVDMIGKLSIKILSAN